MTGSTPTTGATYCYEQKRPSPPESVANQERVKGKIYRAIVLSTLI